MCEDMMSAAYVRCPDCQQRLEMPVTWCREHLYGGIVDERLGPRILLEHARRMPLLHPTVLPEHHLTRRPA
jgi:hypothetical protein